MSPMFPPDISENWGFGRSVISISSVNSRSSQEPLSHEAASLFISAILLRWLYMQAAVVLVKRVEVGRPLQSRLT